MEEARRRIDRGEAPDCKDCGTQMNLKTRPHYDSDQLYHPPEWECPRCGRIYKETARGSWNPPPEELEKGRLL
jgi:hypothetical protein